MAGHEELVVAITILITTVISVGANAFKHLRSRSKSSTMTLLDLKRIKCFDRLDSIKAEYEAFTYKCPLRRELFRIITNIQLKNLKEALSQLVMTEDVGLLTSSEYRAKWKNVISYLKRTNHDDFIREGIPEFLIEKLREKLEPFMNMTNSSIDRVCEDDKVYPNNYVKTSTVMWELVDRITTEVPMLIRTLNSFNGEVSELKLNGYTRKDCKDPGCACNKPSVHLAAVRNANLIQSHRKCVRSRPECAWITHPENLELSNTIDLLNSTFACIKCEYAQVTADCRNSNEPIDCSCNCESFVPDKE
jgi:hypothetical protein